MAVTATAQLRYLKITPRKVRAVVDTIRGCTVNEAEARLLVSPRRAHGAILKLLRSAAANANQNANLDAAKLVIQNIRVDQGPKIRRFTPRARGSSAVIERKSCHIFIELSESSSARVPRYTVTEPPKRKPGASKKKIEAKKSPDEHENVSEKQSKKREEGGRTPDRTRTKGGYLKRMFRRKSI